LVIGLPPTEPVDQVRDDRRCESRHV